MIVVADTTPLNYLILINHVDLLSQLFGQVLIPPAVLHELQDPETPQAVRSWIAKAPSWLQIKSLGSQPDAGLTHLDRGEQEAITLAQELHADQLLIDETAARKEAALRKLPFIGTLGILRKAARLNMIELSESLDRLQQTSFYVNSEIIKSLLEEERARKHPDQRPG